VRRNAQGWRVGLDFAVHTLVLARLGIPILLELSGKSFLSLALYLLRRQ
jgi:hypothetical protein